jgi:hypothetical protein
MADNRHHVDEARSTAGKRILDMMDAVGFDAYAAGWIHDRPTGTWRYLLSTPMLKTKGPIWIYRRLKKVFDHTPLPDGVSPLDIFIIDPDYEMVLFGNSGMGSYVSSVKPPQVQTLILAIAQDIRFDGFSVTDGFASFYRRLAPPDRQRRRNPTRTFDHKVKMLEAA